MRENEQAMQQLLDDYIIAILKKEARSVIVDAKDNVYCVIDDKRNLFQYKKFNIVFKKIDDLKDLFAILDIKDKIIAIRTPILVQTYLTTCDVCYRITLWIAGQHI